MFRYSTVSNCGNRQINEDSVGVFEKDGNNCFVLCDGLGGHGMGDVASNLVVNIFESQFKNCIPKSFLESIFTISQDVLLDKQVEKHAQRKMKTTAVSIVTDKKNAYIGHVGDSRAYVFHKNKVKFHTLDHSIPQMLVFSKEITEAEIRNHPDRNMLLRVLGNEWEKPMFELQKPIPLKKCQAFLLCSDGFWELIDERSMCETLIKAKDVGEWLESMTEIVINNGKEKNMDNYSAIAVWQE